MRLFRSDGTTETDVPCEPGCRYEVATWSRDGTRLALEGTVNVNGAYSVLDIANADGSSPVRIATSPSWCTGNHLSPCTQIHYHPFDANWSVDGRLLYTLDDTALVVAAADGSGKKILFTAADGVRKPQWGPGDHTITFLRGTNFSLNSLNSTDGSELRTIGNFFVGGYAWAPDGSRIAVQVYAAGTIADNSLYLVDPITGQSAQIVQASSEGFAWSPRGNEIAIEKGDSLFVVDTRGSQTLVFGDALDNPEWSPDGRYLIGGKGDGLDGLVYEIGRADGSSRVLALGGSIAHLSVKQGTRWNGFFELFF
jgi:Tol biopolymer transport system component